MRKRRHTTKKQSSIRYQMGQGHRLPWIWEQCCKNIFEGKFETSETVTGLLLCQIKGVRYRILQQKDMIQISCRLDSSAVVVVPAVMPVSVSIPGMA